jgi:hypothetical protein
MSTKESIELDGQRAAAEILSRLPRSTCARLIESIRVINPQSAGRIELLVSDVKLELPKRQLTQRDLTISTTNAPREPQENIPAHLIQPQQRAETIEPKSLAVTTRKDLAKDLEATQAKPIRTLDAAYPEEAPAPVVRRRFGGRVV